jgi:hypothetical protein
VTTASTDHYSSAVYTNSISRASKWGICMFPLKVIWKDYEAFAQDEYSRSATVDWLISEGQIYKDRNNRLSLADEGHRTYCC